MVIVKENFGEKYIQTLADFLSSAVARSRSSGSLTLKGKISSPSKLLRAECP
jgi:hypothetical protein